MPYPQRHQAHHGRVQGSKQGFRAEDAKRPQCNDDEIDDDEGGGREKDVGPAYQDATKTVTSIFGGRASSKDRWK
jgi:hypothetical protein